MPKSGFSKQLMTASLPHFSPPLPGRFRHLVIAGILLTGIMFSMGSPRAFGQESPPTPAPFDPAETQHGYADFDTMPTVPTDTPPEKLPYYDSSHHPASIDDKPKGLFQEITLAENVDEDLEFRRGHLYYPVRPTQQFTSDALAIYIVFRVFKHFTPYQVFAQLYPRYAPENPAPDMMDEDIVYLATEDESGYLKLFPPDSGWQPGAYQVHIFVGFEANPVTRMGTLHFTIVGPS